jgi:hypothetical protein
VGADGVVALAVAWCIQDASRRCRARYDVIHGQNVYAQTAVALATRMTPGAASENQNRPKGNMLDKNHRAQAGLSCHSVCLGYTAADVPVSQAASISDRQEFAPACQWPRITVVGNPPIWKGGTFCASTGAFGVKDGQCGSHLRQLAIVIVRPVDFLPQANIWLRNVA